jgi:DnaK suppressor protein
MTARKTLPKTLQKQLRASLEAERAELLGQVADLDAEADISRWRDGGFDDDPADSGSANVERDRAQSLSTHARRILTAVERALHRMDEGTYGICDNCGTHIQRDRLEALPYATLCMECKRGEERRR